MGTFNLDNTYNEDFGISNAYMISDTLKEIYNLDQNDRENLTEKNIIIDKENLQKVEYIIENYEDFILNNGTQKNILTIWLVVQHGDLETQKKYLPLLKKFVDKELLHPSSYALTIDRILVGEGKPQIYGTQMTRKNINSKLYLHEIENINNVDIRRKKVGLCSLEEELERKDFSFDLSEEQKIFFKI